MKVKEIVELTALLMAFIDFLNLTPKLELKIRNLQSSIISIVDALRKILAFEAVVSTSEMRLRKACFILLCVLPACIYINSKSLLGFSKQLYKRHRDLR